MSATLETLSNAVGNEARDELDGALRKIKHCVKQLTDDQLWWRPSESMNSVANLLLHLCGNLRQWIVSGVGGAADIRERQQEFDERSSAPKTELMQQTEDAVAEAKTAFLKYRRNNFFGFGAFKVSMSPGCRQFSNRLPISEAILRRSST